MGGKHCERPNRQLASEWVRRVARHVQDHAFDTQIAELAATTGRQTVVLAITEILDVTLGGQDRESLANGALAAKTRFAFEGLCELIAGVTATLSRLLLAMSLSWNRLMATGCTNRPVRR